MKNLNSLASDLIDITDVICENHKETFNGFSCGVGSDTETYGRCFPELDDLVENIKHIVSKR